jgi:hypothetical protein
MPFEPERHAIVEEPGYSRCGSSFGVFHFYEAKSEASLCGDAIERSYYSYHNLPRGGSLCAICERIMDAHTIPIQHDAPLL